ncbi:MAG: helix-hairpin-helix domain-containing protein [Bacteroidales bacterium]|nr:helix-hairpin-helix domain-containing protein [Bacteroidales bacterium]
MKGLKSFLSLTRGEQNAIIVLSILIFVAVIVNFFIQKRPPNVMDQAIVIAWEQDVNKFYAAQELAAKRNDSLREASKQRREREYTAHYANYPAGGVATQQKSVDYFLFDPNDATQEEFMQLGFSEKQANAIINYREKGAIFRTKTDFQKVFVVSDAMFEKLEPWISLPKQINYEEEMIEMGVETSKSLIELNSADTTQLKQVKGIGSVLSRRIVEYKEKLGGYYSVYQLLDINGIDMERFAEIESFFVVDASGLRKIDLNRDDFKTMLKHPYLEYYIVKAIFEQKDKIGSFSSVEDVRKIALVYDDLYAKISPYLTATID